MKPGDRYRVILPEDTDREQVMVFLVTPDRSSRATSSWTPDQPITKIPGNNALLLRRDAPEGELVCTVAGEWVLFCTYDINFRFEGAIGTS